MSRPDRPDGFHPVGAQLRRPAFLGQRGRWGGEAFSVPLRCQVNGGAWHECQMVVDQVGSHWQLVLGNDRYGFQHDGRGLVRMRRGSGAWSRVEPRWTADASLCWDGLCAQGAIPLD